MPGKRNIAGPVWHGLDDTGTPHDDGRGEFLQPGVCLAPSPAAAWDYSHGAWRSKGTFDLWQLTLEPADEVHILPQWGAQLIEIRVHNRIKKSRLIWVGERTVS